MRDHAAESPDVRLLNQAINGHYKAEVIHRPMAEL